MNEICVRPEIKVCPFAASREKLIAQHGSLRAVCEAKIYSLQIEFKFITHFHFSLLSGGVHLSLSFPRAPRKAQSERKAK
jgi:hypothetical protein